MLTQLGNSSMNQKLINQYANKYSYMSFHQLVEGYNNIEKELLEEILNDTDKWLEVYGYLKGKQGGVYKKGESAFTVNLSFISNMRTLIITFQELINEENKLQKGGMINQFGLIKKFEIHYHSSISLNFDLLIHKIEERIKAAYVSLEIAFLRSCNDFTKKAYNGLYAILEAALRLNQKGKLFPKCKFTIANEQEGYYYLDETTFKTVINHYTENQNELYSPMELTIWLVSSKYPFQKSVSLQSFKKDKNSITIPFTKSKYILDNPEIVLATMALFKTKNYTTKSICKVRNYFLNISMPDDHRDEVMPIIDKLQETLTEQFKDGIKNCSPLFKILNAASEKISKTAVSDFISTVIAKLGAELIRKPH